MSDATATARAVHERKPQVIGARIYNFETRPAPCPRCAGESVEARIAAPTTLPEAERKRLDAERPFKPQHCATCVRDLEAEERERARAQRIESAIAALNVPPLYRDASLANFQMHGDDSAQLTLSRAAKFAQDFIASWPDVPMIAVFAGGCGTGKGHLTWAIARALAAARGVVARVVVLSDVIRDLREAWNSREDGPSEAERLGKYRGAELLVVDEVSRHAFFGQPQQHLYDLVAWREVQMRPTILTTNELGDDLATVLGPALSSRAAGWNGFVDFGSADYRLTRRLRAS